MSVTGWGVEVFHKDDCPTRRTTSRPDEFNGTNVLLPG